MTSETRKIHKELWIKKDTQLILKQGRYTRNSESRKIHKELWIKEQTSGQGLWITKDIPGILNQERLTWNPESKKIYQEPRIKTDTLGTLNQKRCTRISDSTQMHQDSLEEAHNYLAFLPSFYVALKQTGFKSACLQSFLQWKGSVLRVNIIIVVFRVQH